MNLYSYPSIYIIIQAVKLHKNNNMTYFYLFYFISHYILIK